MTAERTCACPDLEPRIWHEQLHDWKDRRFLATKVVSLLGLPLTYGSAKKRLERRAEKGDLQRGEMRLIQAAKFLPWMILEVRDSEAGKPRFRRVYTELVDAPWGTIGKQVAEVRGKALGRHGKLPSKTYLWYLSCRECSTERGFPTLIVADMS